MPDKRRLGRFPERPREQMSRPKPSGYEHEPDEQFLALSADLYPFLYHQFNPDAEEERFWYLTILSSHRCRNILELGCGTGRICEYLQGAGLTLFGIDNSREMLNFSRNSRHVPTSEMDMGRLGFKRFFDAALLPCNTLNLLQEKQAISQCLSEIRQVLRSPGLLVLHLFVPDQKLIENAGKKLFQFSLADRPDGGRLIRETIRIYDAATQRLTLEERYKIRPCLKYGEHQNYRHAFQLAAFSPAHWFACIEKAGFSIISTSGRFDHSTFQEHRSSTMLLVAGC